ncbi:Ger(x)C family spore germination protein [Paenibacillus chondroitinus]|uniref:Ger(X)C family spore germination protein n=1 Tax=Paenibacillus chondroitinus TaxID=59842 RepID=A0ABU6DDI4_9BACL|nr:MULTISPECIES: Ger(x)C family spore germination protein [Paenibacillus]MCY9658937.1 Ger(x)C family spore germination protein [Paenibacillus anseongense]MEB4795799.1 Ger(x)C family spore germination protein [Paenibacillus chondroitinus]
MIHRSFLSVILLLCTLSALLTGCWDTKDINKRLMPVVMGICKEKNQDYRIVLQIPSPEKQGSQYMESSSATITNAIDNIRTKAEKSIDLLHIRLFLVCEKTAKEDMGDIIDYAIQANDISIKGLLAIVRGDFDEVIHHQIKANPELSSYDFFSEQSGWTPESTIIRLWEAYRNIKSYTQDMSIPILTKGTDTLYRFDGSAIIRVDKMVGQISTEEVLIYNIFQEKYTGGTIEIADQSSVKIKRASIKHAIAWTSSGPQLKSRILLKVEIIENKNEQTEEKITTKLKEAIEKRADKLLTQLKSDRSDALGIGQLFRRKMNEEQLKQWKQQWYLDLDHEITVEVTILNSIYLKSPNKIKKPAN